MSDPTIALLIVIAFIGIVFAIPAPEPKKAPEPPKEAKPIVINVYRTSRVHKHVVVKVQMLVAPAASAQVPTPSPETAAPTSATRALERYREPSLLPASRVKEVA